MKKYSKYIKFVMKYLILVLLLYNITDKILRITEITNYCKECDAIIVDFRSVPAFFHSKYIERVEVDYYDNGRWYKTGEENMNKEDKYSYIPLSYRFAEYESWMKKGDKIKIWVNKDNPKDIHYISFRRMAIWTIITVVYSIFIIVDIIVKRKRKRKLCNF